MDMVAKTEGRLTPWNKGKLLGQKPPLKLKEIWAIRIRLQLDHRLRDLALFNLAVDSKLRGCDLVRLRVHDVQQGSHVAHRAIVMQQKTQRPVQFEVTEQTRDALSTWIATAHLKPEQFLFPSRVSDSPVYRPDSTLASLHHGPARLDLIHWHTARIRCAARRLR
jgi:integrase